MSAHRSNKKIESPPPLGLPSPSFVLVGPDGTIVERFGDAIERAAHAASTRDGHFVADERSGAVLTTPPSDARGVRLWMRARGLRPPRDDEGEDAPPRTRRAPGSRRAAPVRERTLAMLQELLANGPVRTREVDARASELGLLSTLRHLRPALGVKTWRDERGWWAGWPEQVPEGFRVRKDGRR